MRVEASTGLDFFPNFVSRQNGPPEAKPRNWLPESEREKSLKRFSVSSFFSDGLRRSSEILPPVSRCIDTQLRTSVFITMFKSPEKLVKADFHKKLIYAR